MSWVWVGESDCLSDGCRDLRICKDFDSVGLWVFVAADWIIDVRSKDGPAMENSKRGTNWAKVSVAHEAPKSSS